MSPDALKIICIVSATIIGCLAGMVTERALWRNDCEIMGAHVSYMKAYDCKLRQRP